MAPSWRDSACMYSTGGFCDNGDFKKLLRRPTRLDNSESDKLLKRWKLAKDRFGGLLPADHKASYWDDQFVLYVPKSPMKKFSPYSPIVRTIRPISE